MRSVQSGFFTPEPFMVGQIGFALFGPAHLAWIVVLVAAMVAISSAYCSLPETGTARRHMLRVIATIPLCLVASHVVINASVGVTHPNWWPLHVCNLCELLAFVYAFWPNRVVGNILFGVGLPASILAVLFPSWSYCPPLSWASICGFCEHALVAACILCLLRSHEMQPRLRDVWQPLVALAAYVIVTYPLNYTLGTNFAFLKEPPFGSPLGGLASVLGHPGYLVPFFTVVALVIVALFAWQEAAYRRNR